MRFGNQKALNFQGRGGVILLSFSNGRERGEFTRDFHKREGGKGNGR